MGNIKIILAFIVCQISLCRSESDGYINYDRWQLLQIGNINSVPKRNDILLNLENLKDVKIIDVKKDTLLIGVGPNSQKNFLRSFLKEYKLHSKMISNDISTLIVESELRPRRRRRVAGRDIENHHFERYMNYEQMEHLFGLMETSYRNTIRRQIIGQSSEGRNISLFIVSSGLDSNPGPTACDQISSTNRLDKRQTKAGMLIHHIKDRQKEIQNRRQRRLQQRRLDQLRYHPQTQRRKLRQQKRRQRREVHFGGSNLTHNFLYFSFDAFLKQLRQKAPTKTLLELKAKKTKPIIFIDGGVHPREWVSPAAAIYLLKKLAEDPLLTAHIDWHIVPLANPDGYKFSWEKDRFWRKTRSKSGTSGCYGVDMNRNFNHHWGEVDTSINPCSEHYGGESPASEPETVALQNAIAKEQNRIQVYVSLHNWGQDILYPYCYDRTKVSQHKDELERMGQGMIAVIKESQGITYQTGQASELLYPASGTAMDWTYDVAGVPYSYLIELRDQMGILGFLLPDAFIKPTGEDLYAAMKYAATEIQKKNQICT